GLEKVRQDWTWICLAYNVRKLMGWMEENKMEMAENGVGIRVIRLFLALRGLLGARRSIFATTSRHLGFAT
ncbi:MAG: hypothetical protein JJU05_13595, partial [Verrucomicrobia bacterium]|nr:hypothetical protein [Verrucomicrobiota bacterium]